MTEITLAPDLIQIIRREAEQAGKTVEVIANDWLREYHAELRSKELEQQTELFWANYESLYKQYPDEHVAFYDHAVLDHDRDLRALALRIQQKYGDLAVVIGHLTKTPIREYRMISFNLAESRP